MMLQRQQASAIIDARKMIVDGAVGMVEMALDRLSEKKVVELDERKKSCNGFKSSCRLVRQQRCAAYCKFGKFVLIMADQKRNRFRFGFLQNCMMPWQLGQKMIFAQSTGRLNIC